MNKWHNYHWLLSLAACCPLVTQALAQSFGVLHTFSLGGAMIDLDVVSFTNSDGMRPSAGLVLSGNAFYGTAPNGGISGGGTVFKVNIDGTGFITLHDFLGTEDGCRPVAGLTVSGNVLYGTASAGGTSGNGTVFRLRTDGTGFTTLHHFTERVLSSGVITNSDGATPYGALILVGNTLYGTTALGGSHDRGTIFGVAADGSLFTALHWFSGGNDGANPRAGLVCSGDMLYGTSQSGGSGYGTIFAIATNGTLFTNLYSFSGGTDGESPMAELTLSGNALYGSSFYGGRTGNGTVFKVSTDGTGFTTLVEFVASLNSTGIPTNSAGVWPNRLTLSGNTLYGTAQAGGGFGSGTIFAVNTDGTGFTVLYSFTGNNDGALPQAGLIVLGQKLFGTAAYGGESKWGTVFSLSFMPQLTITPVGKNVVLTWPTSYAGFDYTGYALQSTTNLASPVWTTNAHAPITINGQSVVTNPSSGIQQFFRLMR